MNKDLPVYLLLNLCYTHTHIPTDTHTHTHSLKPTCTLINSYTFGHKPEVHQLAMNNQ